MVTPSSLRRSIPRLGQGGEFAGLGLFGNTRPRRRIGVGRFSCAKLLSTLRDASSVLLAICANTTPPRGCHETAVGDIVHGIESKWRFSWTG